MDLKRKAENKESTETGVTWVGCVQSLLFLLLSGSVLQRHGCRGHSDRRRRGWCNVSSGIISHQYENVACKAELQLIDKLWEEPCFHSDHHGIPTRRDSFRPHTGCKRNMDELSMTSPTSFDLHLNKFK